LIEQLWSEHGSRSTWTQVPFLFGVRERGPP
jgi:hypothetical protein